MIPFLLPLPSNRPLPDVPVPGAPSAGSVRPFNRIAAAGALIAALLAPVAAHACACGCGVFDVATSSMLPQGPGGMAYLQYDYQDQNQDWGGDSKAPAADNGDKDIRTNFYTAGVQYLFNRSWGVHLEVPFDTRSFDTTGGASGNDDVTLNWKQIGDVRVSGIYTGFSGDLSSGFTFGLKLPTGSYTHNDPYDDIDRDSQLGTGSTDVLLGGFCRHALTRDGTWTGFAQLQSDLPVLSQQQYRPGDEIDAAEGLYYGGWSLGRARISPIAQVIESYRTQDTGDNAASPVASGYERLLLSPGVEVHIHPMSVYADVEFPTFQHFTGYQLTAPVLVKVAVAYMF